MDTANNNIKAPSKIDTAMDALRAVKDVFSVVSERDILEKMPKGDGHTVLVLPGFMTGDTATAYLRRKLRQFGYNSQPWNLGINLGPGSGKNLDLRLDAKIKELYLTSGHRISIVGWSLGGVLARELARRFPLMIRQVISLASPISGSMESTSLWDVYLKYFGKNLCVEDLERRAERMRQSIPNVPFTSIYTEQDGVIAWQIARVEETELSQNIVVGGSHFGILFNPRALFVICDRLSLADDCWTRMSDDDISFLS